MSETDENAGLALGDYVRILRKNWLLILLSTVLGAVGAGAYSALSTPIYQASASLYVSVRSAGESGVYELTQGGYYAQSAVLSYVDAIDSALVLDRVIDDLDLDMTPRQLAGMISAQSPTDTVLINVDVTGDDPELVAEIANSVGENFSYVASKILEAPDEGGASPVRISTIEPATVPLGPISPNITRNVSLGLMLGLMLGLGAAVLRFASETRIRSQQDVERVTDVPVIGSIIDDPKADKHRLVVQVNPRSVRAESFRSLRTNLQFLNVDNSPRSFLITSAAPNEGKTTVATNLAISLSKTGASVVLVDADLRKPSAAKFMDVDGSVGLSNVLVGMVDLNDALQQWGNSELFVLPSGRIPPNPSELLGSAEMQRLVNRLTESFHYVIIDSPPVLAVTDAALMSRLAGGTIVVAGIGVARRNDIVAALDALGGIATRIVGIVLTRVPSKGPDAYYHYGRYEYAHEAAPAAPTSTANSPLAWLDRVEVDDPKPLQQRHKR